MRVPVLASIAIDCVCSAQTEPTYSREEIVGVTFDNGRMLGLR
jgi:hypothetical protein